MTKADQRFARKYPEIARQEADHDLVDRFTHHPPAPDQYDLYGRVRASGLDFARVLNAYVPGGAELQHAIDNIDQAVMWANAGIARRS